LKAKCVKGEKVKRKDLMVPVGSMLGNLTKAMAAKIDSEKGRRIYHQRLAIAEPVFANIRVHKVMNRFTLRGRIKVNIQWLLYCMVHNIGKILTRGPVCIHLEEEQGENRLHTKEFDQKAALFVLPNWV